MIYLLCGDCAVRAIGDGAVQVPGRIDLGTACEAHPSRVPAQATALIDAAAPLAPALAEPEPDDAPAVVRLGPETEIAARLLASWSAATEGARADEIMIRAAAKTARALLRETKGR